MTAIEVIRSTQMMLTYADAAHRAGERLCLVPTMGYFHDGHLSLMRKGRTSADRLVVSIFVNPTQFGPGEDLAQYPRSPERDMTLAAQEGVDIVFMPEAGEMYPDGYQTYVNLAFLPNHLCGLSRPLHFRGVATVVIKLFNIVRPDVAVFGQKDFQQVAVIRRMVRDLNVPVTIIETPTVRESDGLAMSSRNSYLTADQRLQARALFQTLQSAQKRVKAGVIEASELIAEATERITAHPDTEIDYIEICDPETLESAQQIRTTALMALAVRIGKTRLIDNILLTPTGRLSTETPKEAGTANHRRKE